ncbi:MAG: NAD(P)-binding protein [Candidatus Aegiribacteria sp.]|nr:NAD(P)-binding protein [Candidatus Aegiribacteria sp.]
MSSTRITGAVLVVGGGIGGIQSSLDLAESGFKVYLVEKSPAIGGTMPQLDKTFPTNDCSMCILSPKLVECGRHLNIEILTNAELKGISGKPGNFKAVIEQKPRYVAMDKCTGCGDCAEKCPVKLPDLFNKGLSQRKAIFRLFEQAYPPTFAIEKEACLECGICARHCAAEAIDFEMEPNTLEINIGSIILSPGFEEFDAGLIANYGYGIFKNVITSIEFERILSASGPYQGQLLRPSDMKPPQRIAWIQCVGSRDIHKVNNNYCSAVCCTYAIKEAVVAKEHSSTDLNTTIFYIDIRTYGKGFENYYERAKEEHGVRFVKSEIHRIYRDENENLILRFSENNKIKEEEFDLVVLSVGVTQSEANQELAKTLGIQLNQHGFCRVEDFSPVSTSRAGIFTAGVFSEPKDIPETVMAASAAAGEASGILAAARHTLARDKEYPQEKNIIGEKPRIGIFICHCGINIGSVVDISAVKDYAATLQNVVFVEDSLFTCSQDSQQKIKERIEEHNLNRVVVAACTPRTHEPLFQETLRETGLNKYLFEMANIRDQCSWVHQGQPEKATEKAKDLIRMSVAKAKLIEPLFQTNLEVNHSALVVGGGISGMVSALTVARQGFKVHVIEKSSRFGGIANNIYSTIEGFDVQVYLKELIDEVSNNPLIHLYTEAEILDVSGYVGNFKTRLVIGAGKEEKEITHGVVVIASGGDIYKPNEYLYGNNPNVFSLIELEGEIAKKNNLISTSRNIVLIQCIGSRDDERSYCSRTCCSKAVKLSLELKKLNPDVNIYVLYRDIRTYGFKEQYYLEAREKGVLFIPYDVSDKPEVEAISKEGKDFIKVTVNDLILNESFSIDADILALATAIIPSPDSKKLAGLFKVPLDENGFFMEAHIKLRPVDFPTEGVFVCGLAHSPKLITESIIQAKAAASRACIILSRDKIESGATVSTINKDKCSGCGMCMELCPFIAIEIDGEDNTATVNEALCKGCGVCASSCRCGAVDIMGFTNNEIYSMIKNGAFGVLE